MNTMMSKHTDSVETYHIVLPVRPMLARKFDEEISPNKPQAIFCCSDLCRADDPAAHVMS